MRSPSFRLARPAAARLLLVCLILLALEAWYPFRFELPGWRPSAAERQGGEVAFAGRGQVLASRPGVEWVAGAAETSRLQVRLEARTDDADQRGPARLLAVSEDHFRADLMVGQDGDGLVVRVRRPGSDASGEPPFRVGGVFARDEWRALSVTVADARVRVSVDGQLRLDEAVGADPLGGWDPAQRVALGDDPKGERSWQGRLRLAEVSAGDDPPVDLLGPGALGTGGLGGWRLRSRVGDLVGSGTRDPLLVSLVRVLVFVPVGAGLRRLLRKPARAAAAVTLSAVALTVGKAFVAGRHPSLLDTGLSLLGGLAGTTLTGRALRCRRPSPHGAAGQPRRPAGASQPVPAGGGPAAERADWAGNARRLRHTGP